MVYKLSPDILNIAVWSWQKDGGKAQVSCTRKIFLTLLSILVLGAQLQSCYVICKNFLMSVQCPEAKDVNECNYKFVHAEERLKNLLEWDLGVYISAVVCFALTSYQTFDDGKQRIINMTNTRNPIMWLLNYVAYAANFSVATAVFFTILQQSNVNDLWTNYAGLLILIQIDNIIGEWACEYIIDIDEEKEHNTFLVMKHVTDIEIAFSEKVISFLMLIFTIWTSMVYKFLAQYDPKDAGSEVALYLMYTYIGFYIWPFVQLFMKVFCHCCFCCKCCKTVDEDLEIDVAGGRNIKEKLVSSVLKQEDFNTIHELEKNDEVIAKLEEKISMLKELIAKKEA